MTKTGFDSTVFIPFDNMVFDTRQMYILVDHLEGVKRFLFKDKEGTISQKAEMFLSSNLDVIFKDLEQRGLEPANDAKQQEFLTEIVHHLKRLPAVKVNLAFEPSVTFINFMASAVSLQIGYKVLLDIVVDQFIVAGATFEFAGKYADYTLAVSIDNFIGNYVKGMGKKSESNGLVVPATV